MSLYVLIKDLTLLLIHPSPFTSLPHPNSSQHHWLCLCLWYLNIKPKNFLLRTARCEKAKAMYLSEKLSAFHHTMASCLQAQLAAGNNFVITCNRRALMWTWLRENKHNAQRYFAVTSLIFPTVCITYMVLFLLRRQGSSLAVNLITKRASETKYRGRCPWGNNSPGWRGLYASPIQKATKLLWPLSESKHKSSWRFGNDLILYITSRLEKKPRSIAIHILDRETDSSCSVAHLFWISNDCIAIQPLSFSKTQAERDHHNVCHNDWACETGSWKLFLLNSFLRRGHVFRFGWFVWNCACVRLCCIPSLCTSTYHYVDCRLTITSEK